LVILAADRQHHPFGAKRQELMLKILEGRSGKILSESDALQPILPDDSAPELVIAIDHKAFLGSVPLSVQRDREIFRDFVPELLGVRLSVEVPFSRIDAVLDANQPLDPL